MQRRLSVTMTHRRNSTHDVILDMDRKQSIVSPVIKPTDPMLENVDLKSPVPATAAPTPAPARARPKILFLDGLRGLAAMLVVTQHMKLMDELNFGGVAVDAFFVLSAFLLTMILEKKARTLWNQPTTKRTWAYTMLDYFARRLLRVYPLFVAAAVLLWILPAKYKEQYYLIKDPQSFNIAKVLTFSFNSRYHVFWTLPLEITYYFVIPVIVFAVLLLRKWWWLPMLPALGWICYEGIYTYRWDHLGLRAHFPTFLAGSIGAIVFNRLDAVIKEHTFKFAKWMVFVIRCIEYTMLAFLFSVCFRGLLFNWVISNPAPDTPGAHFVSVHVTFIMVVELILPGPLARALEWNFLRYAGKVSFSMYLLHSFVLYGKWVPTGYYDRFFVVFVGTFAISTLSYRLIEFPMQKIAGKVGAYCKKQTTKYVPVQLESAHEVEQTNLETGFVVVEQTPVAITPTLEMDKLDRPSLR